MEVTLAAIAGSYDAARVWDNAAQVWRSHLPGDALWIRRRCPAGVQRIWT
ncbi:MAG: hypothetical protein K1X65_09870 [Caldilineales bacterium]|nr:hypothetical protein [Caldilineales bacterium]